MKQSKGKYRAFISYSHVDTPFADWLHKALESYRLPSKLVGIQTAIGRVTKNLTPIFRDRDELPAAGDLSVELRTALVQSNFLIVIASPASAQSRWVNEEVRHFKHIHGEGRVLLLIVDGAPGAGDHTECFPLAACRKVDSQGQITEQIVEPIAADIRPGGDGKRLAKLKLVAGLTGLPLDKLVQREQARRHRQLAAVAMVAAVIAISMSILAFKAVQGQKEAERQRAESDGLVEYMLTDLRMQLEPVGRLEIFDSVGQRALAYYAKQDINALDADALGRRARALLLVGEVRELRGDSSGALEAFETAAQTTAELLARDPQNESRIFDHSQSVFWIGYVAWQRNEVEAAERWFLEYYLFAKQLVSIAPDKDEWRVELSSATVNLGVLLHNNKRHEEAAKYFRQALEVDTTLASADPDNLEKQWTVAQDHAWLSNALSGMWEFNIAKEERHKELAIYAGMLAVDDRDARALEGSAVARIEIAELYIIAGQYDLAEKTAKDGLEDIELLLKEDTDNRLWQDIFVSATNQYVEALMMLGKWIRAEEFNQLALARSEALVESDSTVMAWKNIGLANARWMAIAIDFALNEIEQAQQGLVRFTSDFGTLITQPKEANRSPWCMVMAMAALNTPASSRASSIQESIITLRTLDLNMPRELLVLSYLEGNTSSPNWPAHRAAQASVIGYNPAHFLALVKGN